MRWFRLFELQISCKLTLGQCKAADGRPFCLIKWRRMGQLYLTGPVSGPVNGLDLNERWPSDGVTYRRRSNGEGCLQLDVNRWRCWKAVVMKPNMFSLTRNLRKRRNIRRFRPSLDRWPTDQQMALPEWAGHYPSCTYQLLISCHSCPIWLE